MALQSCDTLPGKTCTRIQRVPGVQPWAPELSHFPGRAGGTPLGLCTALLPAPQEVLALGRGVYMQHPAPARGTLGAACHTTPTTSLLWVIQSRFQARLTARRGRLGGPGVVHAV